MEHSHTSRASVRRIADPDDQRECARTTEGRPYGPQASVIHTWNIHTLREPQCGALNIHTFTH